MTTPKTRLGIALLMLLSLTPNLRAEGRVVREFKTEDFPTDFAANKPPGDTLPADGVWRLKWDDRLSVETLTRSTSDTPHTVTVLALDNPGITQTRYFLLGDVEYANVDGRAYLEMWNDFPDGGHFFTRTMGDSGPMMTISGTSAKRPFMLPFNSEPGKVPSKLTLNVVMPGKGKVTLSRVRLVENGEPATRPAGAKNDVNTLDGEVLALRDPLRNGRPAGGGLARMPSSMASTSGHAADATDHDPLSAAGLPPEVAAQVRRQLTTELLAAMKSRDNAQQNIDTSRQLLGRNSPEVRRAEEQLKAFNRRIEVLTAALAEPQGVVAVTPPPPPTGLLAWLDRYSAFIFAGLVAVTLLATVPLRMLMKSGRGRAVVVGFFGLMFVGGVGQLFAAGVALGMGRPADAWVTLLGCSAILIVCGGLMMRQAKAYYAGFELRKLRAMDVA